MDNQIFTYSSEFINRYKKKVSFVLGIVYLFNLPILYYGLYSRVSSRTVILFYMIGLLGILICVGFFTLAVLRLILVCLGMLLGFYGLAHVIGVFM